VLQQLRLPLWFITERNVRSIGEHTPCNDPRATHVFTETEGLAALLRAGSSGRWQIDLVADSDELLLVLGDLHHKKVANVCVDPGPDGSGGVLVALADLVAFCRALPQLC
jgi:hypothetical protein